MVAYRNMTAVCVNVSPLAKAIFSTSWLILAVVGGARDIWVSSNLVAGPRQEM